MVPWWSVDPARTPRRLLPARAVHVRGAVAPDAHHGHGEAQAGQDRLRHLPLQEALYLAADLLAIDVGRAAVVVIVVVVLLAAKGGAAGALAVGVGAAAETGRAR